VFLLTYPHNQEPTIRLLALATPEDQCEQVKFKIVTNETDEKVMAFMEDAQAASASAHTRRNTHTQEFWSLHAQSHRHNT